MGYVALQMVSSFSSEAARNFRDTYIATDAMVHTDGLKAFNLFGEGSGTHVVTLSGSKRPARERDASFFILDNLIANLSTALKATYTAFSPKHLPDYLCAFCWNTNRRHNMRGMVDALLPRAIAENG
jgi:hypothetical protein